MFRKRKKKATRGCGGTMMSRKMREYILAKQFKEPLRIEEKLIDERTPEKSHPRKKRI